MNEPTFEPAKSLYSQSRRTCHSPTTESHSKSPVKPFNVSQTQSGKLREFCGQGTATQEPCQSCKLLDHTMLVRPT